LVFDVNKLLDRGIEVATLGLEAEQWRFIDDGLRDLEQVSFLTRVVF
jgi:hypothetical protein